MKGSDFSKYLNNLSSRHHYIPQFLINGFVNDSGLLYVFDKKKGMILKRPRPPKSIFFENDRNTIQLNTETKTSILEDLLYKEIDDKSSKSIKKYQTQDLSCIDFSTEDTSSILFFLISLFWRIPKTDYAADNLMENSSITSEGIAPEVLKADPTFRKMSRATLFKHHIDEISKSGLKGHKWHNIHQSGKPVYLIGDYPILFRRHINKFSEFNDCDFLFAISSSRIYSSTNEKMSSFAAANPWRYNACIIDQSVRYAACGSMEALENSVNFYRKLKETGLIYGAPEAIFRGV